MLTGVRFDGAPKADTIHVTVGLVGTKLDPDSTLTPDTQVSLFLHQAALVRNTVQNILDGLVG